MTLGRQFDPYSLKYGEEVTVDPEAMDHPAIRLNERDPRRGGHTAAVFDNAMDDFAPGHGMGDRLKHAHLTRSEVSGRNMQAYEIGRRYEAEHGQDFRKDPEIKAKYQDEVAPLRNTSLTGDEYIEGIANSMKAHGQQHPGILISEEGGFWLGEGNHRLAAARRHGLPFTVKRRDKG